MNRRCPRISSEVPVTYLHKQAAQKSQISLDQVRVMCEETGLTPRQIAKVLGLSENTARRWSRAVYQ